MQQQNTGDDGRIRRLRSTPKPLGLVLLAVPVVATAGAFGVPSLAATSASAAGPSAAPLSVAAAPVAWHGTVRVPPARRPLAAFFQAGYRYDDAVLLARLWGHRTTPQGAKVRAGNKLLHHQALPTKPGQTARTVSQDAALAAFFDNGYTYDDAARLAKAWHAANVGGDLSSVKVRAGRNILAGRPVSARPRDLPTATTSIRAFRQAGYGYDDAVLLARLWGAGLSPADAKVRAGTKLLDGAALPTRPGQTAWTVDDDAALDAYFDNGYAYDDAVQLAAVWHRGKDGDDLSAVKATAGRKLLAGIALPTHH